MGYLYSVFRLISRRSINELLLREVAERHGEKMKITQGWCGRVFIIADEALDKGIFIIHCGQVWIRHACPK